MISFLSLKGREKGPIAKRWEGEGMKRPPANVALKRVRSARQRATSAEARLWQVLRSRQLNGAKFRRQVWLGPYIADFFCADARLIVEVDGESHALQTDYEDRRTDELRQLGFRVLRVTNGEVMGNLEGVLAHITALLPSPAHPALPGGTLPLP